MTQLFNFSFSALRSSLAIGVIALGASAPAQAIVYDFKFTGGGQSSLAFASSHLFVDVTENSTTAANDVLFTFTNELIEPQASIVRFYFDTGVYTNLFTGMSVWETSGLVNLVPNTPQSHPFLPANFTPNYQFGQSATSVDGINPGESATLSALLSTGTSFSDVIGSLNEGLSSATGLRVGLFTYHLLGDLPHDDAAHVTNSIVAVPEAETWAMMLVGLGLIGFMAYRRKS
jgi:hypothetical protein